MVNIHKKTGEIEAEKVATLDMGGTLVDTGEAGSSFQEINLALGLPERVENGIFASYQQEDNDIGNYRKHADALTSEIQNHEHEHQTDIRAYAEAVQNIVNERETKEGADEFVESLREEGYYTMALSSAPRATVIPFAEELGLDAVYIFRDFIFSDDGSLRNIYVDPVAPHGKHEVVKQLQESGVTVHHVGNGGNDVEAAGAADIGSLPGSFDKKTYEKVLDEVA